MNPSLPADYLDRMREDDPEAYRSEILGEFRAGVATLFEPDALDRCVIPDRREIQPAPGIRYRAFVDPSGGSRDADLDRSALYLELLPPVNANTVEILDDPKLLQELRGLERRRGPAGRDRVNHRPGQHDDRANAVAGVVAACGTGQARRRCL